MVREGERGGREERERGGREEREGGRERGREAPCFTRVYNVSAIEYLSSPNQ